MTDIAELPVVVFAGQSWSGNSMQGAGNIVKELSSTRKVLYVNPPSADSGLELEEAGTNLWVLKPRYGFIPLEKLVRGSSFGLLHRINNQNTALRIRGALKILNISKFWLLNFNDVYHAAYMKEMLRPRAAFYYDLGTPGHLFLDKQFLSLEKKLLQKYTACFVGNFELQKQFDDNNARAYCLRQGLDHILSLKDRGLERPAGMPKQKPIAGYAGPCYEPFIDQQILTRLAREMPEVNFVLAGTGIEDLQQSAMAMLENVFFLEEKELHELAACTKYFDVGLFLPRKSDLTGRIYPYEVGTYLAFGKPVVTNRAVDLTFFSPYVYHNNTYQDIQESLYKALAGKDEAAAAADRVNFIQKHTWKNCISAMMTLVCQPVSKEKRKKAEKYR